MDFVHWMTGALSGADENPEKYGVYAKSVNRVGDALVFMAEHEDATVLVATGAAREGFGGSEAAEGGLAYRLCPLNRANAAALRKLFPFTAPVPVLRSKCSFGVGDRLGIATPGHLRVFEAYDALPILAQQSIRELDLTGRTYEDVLDSATFAVYREGFRRGFGADGDHLKRAEDVKYALGLGFTMITLDCSEHIRNDVGQMSEAQVKDAVTLDPALSARYLGKTFDIGGIALTFTEDELRRNVLIYGKAVDFAVSIYEQFFAAKKNNADFEISIDETATPTTPLQHFFVASELTLRGVAFATLAPRFCGEFQKGIDYVGDVAQFTQEIVVHQAIAKHFGYKLSVHSGSDKFTVFPIVGRETGGSFHVKTAGTNWLEAMRVVASVDPVLYRDVHKFALRRFSDATKYYHVTTDLSKIPDVDTLSDAELPGLFAMNDARQLIHITYGLILSEKAADGSFVYRDKLYRLWKKHEQAYSDALFAHIGKHMELLGVPKR